MEQLTLFNLDEYDIRPKLYGLRASIRINGWAPFSVDKLQKAGMLYGVLCNTVFSTYEEVVAKQCAEMKENDNDE